MRVLLLALIAVMSCSPPGRLRVQGTEFVQADGSPFMWRGVTAFRLAELVAGGREAEAIRFLDWARASKVTVVRVLAMAQHLFKLSPADGLRALPRVLDLAAERGIHVEIVALADSAEIEVDLEAHVRAVGAIAARHANALVEIANEPFHPTQHERLHDRATLAALARLIPDEVLVAFGSDLPDNSGGGDYVTVHLPRGEKPWDHVEALAQGRELVARYKVPVVSDEPMGAAATLDLGRRDNSPERFRAAARRTREAGMHATFHYEGGLHARPPDAAEQRLFDAWLDGLSNRDK